MTQGRVNINGPAIVVRMFRSMDEGTRKAMLPQLAKASPLLLKLTAECGFILEDLPGLSPHSVDQCLRATPSDELLVAFKLCSPGLRDFILENMSERRRQDFIRDFEKLPLMKKSQVLRIKHKIARQMVQILHSSRVSGGR